MVFAGRCSSGCYFAASLAATLAHLAAARSLSQAELALFTLLQAAGVCLACALSCRGDSAGTAPQAPPTRLSTTALLCSSAIACLRVHADGHLLQRLPTHFALAARNLSGMGLLLMLAVESPSTPRALTALAGARRAAGLLLGLAGCAFLFSPSGGYGDGGRWLPLAAPLLVQAALHALQARLFSAALSSPPAPAAPRAAIVPAVTEDEPIEDKEAARQQQQQRLRLHQLRAALRRSAAASAST